MTNLVEDPLYVILRSKRESTRFQILVEIAEHQPSIRQQEIADKLGVTPQAVSEYIREMADEGLVTAHGRGRYEVTKGGIEWVLRHAEALESYARHITQEVIQQVAVWTAIAKDDLVKSDQVGVFMQDGWLYATKEEQNAMGQATMDARVGEDVGVANLNGIIDHDEGTIHVCKVPRIERGGSRQVRTDLLRAVVRNAEMVAAVGLESYVALKKAEIEPDMFFGSREGVIEAAFHGRECAILIVDEEFTDFLKRLETAGLTYVIHDIAP